MAVTNRQTTNLVLRRNCSWWLRVLPSLFSEIEHCYIVRAWRLRPTCRRTVTQKCKNVNGFRQNVARDNARNKHTPNASTVIVTATRNSVVERSVWSWRARHECAHSIERRASVSRVNFTRAVQRDAGRKYVVGYLSREFVNMRIILKCIDGHHATVFLSLSLSLSLLLVERIRSRLSQTR